MSHELRLLPLNDRRWLADQYLTSALTPIPPEHEVKLRDDADYLRHLEAAQDEVTASNVALDYLEFWWLGKEWKNKAERAVLEAEYAEAKVQVRAQCDRAARVMGVMRALADKREAVRVEAMRAALEAQQ